MNSTENLSEIIIRKIEKESDGLTEHDKVQLVENLITWHLNDVFKVLKNINTTSLNSLDRAQRIIELETKYGIPKTHLI